MTVDKLLLDRELTNEEKFKLRECYNFYFDGLICLDFHGLLSV